MDEEIIREEEAIAEERAADATRLGATILNRAIREVSTMRPAARVPPSATLRAAVLQMRDGRSGCVLVEEEGRLVGIFTERDLVTRVVCEGLDVERTEIGTVMTPNPQTLSPGDRVAFALHEMNVAGFRHIPLVDEDGRAVGVISMRNMVNYMVDLFRTEVLNLPPPERPGVQSREGA